MEKKLFYNSHLLKKFTVTLLKTKLIMNQNRSSITVIDDHYFRKRERKQKPKTNDQLFLLFCMFIGDAH
ncbi:hypothetical protein T07_787 [Trichinella nelsoni]|uniref:Uncharacterized protein n=1 Tax=Trichinella nelsoni TaxID=6336 RepID=A0A0V0S913_9BILA|nr:hypothetical protein T07_787 [Trichinella nelsoni]